MNVYGVHVHVVVFQIHLKIDMLLKSYFKINIDVYKYGYMFCILLCRNFLWKLAILLRNFIF